MNQKFIWYFYSAECDNFPSMKLSYYTRIFYMATYVSSDGILKNNCKNINKVKLESVMGLSPKEFKRFWEYIINSGIISYDGYSIKINTNIFHIGWIKPKLKFLKESESKIVKVYVDEMRFIYENSTNRGHRIIGNIFKLIPYYNFKSNLIVKRKTPLNYKETAELLGYDANQISRLDKVINSIVLKNGERILMVCGDENLPMPKRKAEINKLLLSIAPTEEQQFMDEIDVETLNENINLIRNKNDECGFVYFVNVSKTSQYKIGCTTNLDNRICALQTATPNKLTLIHSIAGGYKTEKYLHKVFKQYQIRNEWFDLPDYVSDEIKNII